VEIRELRAFVAVVEEGGLSAGARRLHLSQSALSQTVQALERRLGAPLLVRGHTGVRPTELGGRLLDGARDLLARHDRMLAELTAPAAEDAPLRVGLPLEFPVEVLPGALDRLAATHRRPRLEVRHSSSVDQLAALARGELDLALVRDRPDDPRWDSALAVEESMGVLLDPVHAERLAEPAGVRLHRLAGLEWAGFSRSDAPAWYDQVTATLRTHGVPVTNRFADAGRPVTLEVKLAAVATGRVFGFSAPGWGRRTHDGVRWYPLVGDPLMRLTWAVWHADARGLELAALVAELDLSG
jgi:DNA-binding transcriptional LysR family regulator